MTRILADPELAIDTFVAEEVGLSAATMGSPVSAAAGSLGAFSMGALVPLLPFLLLPTAAALPLAVAASLLALFAIEAGVSRQTHRPASRTGLRQMALGALAAAATYGIGALLGAAVHEATKSEGSL